MLPTSRLPLDSASVWFCSLTDEQVDKLIAAGRALRKNLDFKPILAGLGGAKAQRAGNAVAD